MTKSPSRPALCLAAVALPGPAWIARVETALEATRATTLILDAPDGGAIGLDATSALVRMAQRKNVAALIVDDWRAARAAGADGVHITVRADLDDAYRAARAGLDPGSIVGADAGKSRHDAMMLGEAGADYVAFGRASPMPPAPETGNEGETNEDTQADLVGWWSEIFVVPVVAFGIETAEDAAVIARAQPDFIAVRLPRDDADTTPVSEWASNILAAIGKAAGAKASSRT